MTLPDNDDLSEFGGLAKQNYANTPPASPIFDWDNTLIAPAFCDVACMTLTAPRTIVQMTLAATTGALVLNNWWAVWANSTTTAPILVRVGPGDFTITWPSVVSDEYSASLGQTLTHSVNLLSGWANLEQATGVYSASVSSVANVTTIKLFNTAGANDFVGLVLDVFSR